MDYLISEIEKTVAVAKEHLTGAVNQTMTEIYWRIGRYIVEFEQSGNEKEIYGKNFQEEYDFNTSSLSPVQIKEIKQREKQMRVDYALALMGIGIYLIG